jgi:hypothetical protein
MHGGIASCCDAKTGERKYQSRIATGTSVSDEEANAGRGGRGGGGGGDYASPVLAVGKLIYTTKSGKFWLFRRICGLISVKTEKC